MKSQAAIPFARQATTLMLGAEGRVVSLGMNLRQ
jgi:hypothetical protein